MRILHLLDHSAPQHSGYTFRSLAILRNQNAVGIETVQMTSLRHGDTDDDFEVAEGVKFFRTKTTKLGWLRRIPLIGEILITAKRAEQLARDHKVQVIHAHSPLLHGYSAWVAARRIGIPFTYEVRAFWEDAAVDVGKTSVNSLRYRLTRYAETIICKRANHVFPICQGIKDDLHSRGVEYTKMCVVPNAVEAERFPIEPRDEQLRASLGIATDEFVFGFFGSFYHYEGLQVLLKALPELNRSGRRFKVLLAGTGEAEAQVRQLCLDTAIGSHVLYVGKIPNTEIVRYYSAADAMIYPRLSSRLTELTTPLKPLEALAVNRIVLLTDIGGHRELIEDNKTGIMFEPGKPSSCAAAMLRVINLTASERSRIIKAGDDFVRVKRSWRAVAERYLSPYAKVVGKGKY
jgi:glycogen synthase